MDEPWPAGGDGVVILPSGRRVRGRGLRRDPAAIDGLRPEFGVYLLNRQPPSTNWDSRWVRWPDFRAPVHRSDAVLALVDLLERAGHQRVEVACSGGTGRTGTAIAGLAVLDGVPANSAIVWARTHYRRRAVETHGQRRFVQGLTGLS